MIGVLSVRRRLGQFGLTEGLARQIVSEAEPATRRIIREERTKYAEAFAGGIGWAAGSALTFIGTRYFVPDTKTVLKGVGYGASALLLGVGAIWSLASLREEPAAPEAPSQAPGFVKSAAEQAARAVVTEAEPKIRTIVDDERARIASAALAGLPFAAAGALTLIGTMFLVTSEKQVAKAAGYAAATGLFSIGAWIALEKEKA